MPLELGLVKLITSFFLGAAQFGQDYGVMGTASTPEAMLEKLLQDPQTYGINGIDTSPTYGSSEKLIGKYASKEILISTKVKGTDDPSQITQSISESLRQLQRPKLDNVIIHNWDQLNIDERDATLTQLLKLQENGLIHEIGISTYCLLKPAQVDSLPKFISNIQLPLSALDQRRLESIKKIKNTSSLKVSARSVFLQGIATLGMNDPRFKSNSSLKKFWLWCETQNITAAEACLWFVASRAELDSFVIGVKSMSEAHGVKKCLDSLERINDLDFTHLSSQDEWLLNPVNWS